MSGYKTISYLPGWAQDNLDDTTNKINTTSQAYAYVPLIYRAVKLRANALASVSVSVYRGDTEIEWPFQVKWSRFISMTSAAKSWCGAAYWVKRDNPYNPKNIEWLNPFTMKAPVMQPDGSLQFRQEINGAQFGPWQEQEIIYLKDFINPTDDIGPGVSPVQVAMTEAGLLRYLSRFASKFFESGAMPLTIIGIDGSMDADEVKRVEGFFKKQVSGISNAWRVLAMRMRGTMKPEVITPKMSDMAMGDVYDQAVKNIAFAFGIPESMLRNDANRASAEENRLSYWQDTVRPDGNGVEADLNEQLFNPMGLEIVLNWEQLDVFQEDESNRAGSLESLVNAGVPLLPAMEILGYDLTDEQMVAITSKPEPVPEPVIQQPVIDEPATQPDDNKALRNELRAWERFTINSITGKSKPGRVFQSDIIPLGLYGAIEGSLEDVRDVKRVRSIFTNVLDEFNLGMA